MTKSISSALSAHLSGQSTTLARCWKIVRTDGAVYAFTTSDIALTLPNTPLYVVQSAEYEHDAVQTGTNVQVTFGAPVTNGNLLVAFFTASISGVSDSIIDTTQWTIEAHAFNGTSSSGFWVLTRYASPSDGVSPPSVTNGTLSTFAYVALTMQEVGGVTGTHSVDVPYAHANYALDVSSLSAGSFTATDPFAFTLVGAFGASSGGAPTFPAGFTTDESMTSGVYSLGCAHELAFVNTVSPTVTVGGVDVFAGMIGMNAAGLTFEPAQGFMSTAMENKSDFSVDNLEVQGAFNSESITVADLRSGAFDYADVFLFLVNWQDITQGILSLRRGKLGEVTSSPQGWFKAELRGMTQLLQQQVIELFGPDCRADLGDGHCTMPIDPPLWHANTTYNTVVNQVNTGAWVKAPLNSNTDYSKYENVIFQCTTAGKSGTTQPTFNTTLGATTSDGTVVWTAVAAWTRDGAVATVIDPLNITVTFTSEDSRDVDQWYRYGTLKWDTGLNAGRALEVKGWVQSGRTITFYVTAGYAMAIGDKFHVGPGCDKSNSVCKNTFANLLNMRGEPFLPGNDFVFYYPNAMGPGTQQP